MPLSYLEKLESDGFATVPNVVSLETVTALIEALNSVQDEAGVQRRRDVYAIRNLLEVVPEVSTLADSPEVRTLVESVLGSDAFEVRGILFDKIEAANWKVPWHQDLTIAVRERREVDGFGPWSLKAGIPHVQPPVEILEQMLTVRLHLDDCDESNGPLQVIPGSHHAGRLDTSAIQQYRERGMSVSCPLLSGGALLMRPLLLHASTSSQTPRHRRVIHLEFAAESLPGGLEWHSQLM